MKNLILIFFVALTFTISINAQTTPATTSTNQTTAEEKPKKQIFRAKKDSSQKQR